MFERGSEAVGADVTVQAERSRLLDHCVPVREDKDRSCCEFREESANNFFHCGSEGETSAFLEQGRNRAYAPGRVRQELWVVTVRPPSRQRSCLILRGHRRVNQGGGFVLVRADTTSRGDVADEVDTRGWDFFGEGPSLWRRKRAKKAARFAT